MSERTGLGIVEIAILKALDTSRYLSCSKALARVEERIDLAPGYAYEVLVDLARPWTMPVNLVHGQGNFGRQDTSPEELRDMLLDIPGVYSRSPPARISSRPTSSAGCWASAARRRG